MELIKAITPEQWSLIGETVISALFLSPFMLAIKKWLNIHRELVMLLWVIGGAVLTAAVAYVNQTPDFAPWLIIPIQGLVTFALSQPVYFAVIKPIRRHVNKIMEDVNVLNEAKRAAALPNLSETATDFK